MSERFKRFIKLTAKVGITAVALWIVFRNISFQEVVDVFKRIDLLFFVLSVLVFIVSKVVASVRLKYFFRVVDLDLPFWYNFRLYLIGMFHNLYLPGGVGGDGYKIYLLNKHFGTTVKPLIGASLLDRASGLAALLFLANLLLVASSGGAIFGEFPFLLYYSLAGIYPVYFLLYWLIYRRFRPVIWKTAVCSLLAQALLLLCAYCLLQGLGVSTHIPEYLAVFMLASVATIIPVTVGGAGLRELVFLLSYQRIGLDRELSIAFSLLFFIVTALVSIAGAFIKLPGNSK